MLMVHFAVAAAAAAAVDLCLEHLNPLSDWLLISEFLAEFQAVMLDFL